jgi:hypothetical protein
MYQKYVGVYGNNYSSSQALYYYLKRTRLGRRVTVIDFGKWTSFPRKQHNK